MSTLAQPSPASVPPVGVAAASPAPSTPKKGRAPRLMEKDRQVRQELVLMKTICGEKAKAIAEQLHVSLATVKTDLLEARRSGMVAVARDTLVGMIPKALAVLDTHLEAGDKDVALIVLEGLGIIGKNMQVTLVPPGGVQEDTFYAFRSRVLQTKQAGDTSVVEADTRPAAQLCAAVVDAEIETSGSKAVGNEGASGGTI